MRPFDIDAYFTRIGHERPSGPTLDVLRSLHLAHPAAIPFENLDPLMGRPIDVEPDAIFDKLVTRRRGGYCFEHNLLFAAILREIGFEVETLAARVVRGRPPGTVAPRTHMLLCVNLPEGDFIADTGFGGLTLTAPLRLVPDEVQATPHGDYRLLQVGEVFDLQALLANEWQTMFGFELHPQENVDWQVANWFTSTHPESIFLHSLMAARPVGDRRLALRNGELAIYSADGSVKRRRLATVGEICSALENEFGITLPQGTGEVLERLFGGNSPA